MEATKKTKKSWNDQDTNTVIWHSKGIKAKAACSVLEGILLDRTPDAILSKVYEVQKNERENALKAYRALETTRKPEVVEIIAQDNSFNEDDLHKELSASEIAIKERLNSLQEEDSFEEVFEKEELEPKKTKEPFYYTEEDLYGVENGSITILGGGIKIPFAGLVSSDFEIEGTFTIRKIRKTVLI